MEGASRFYNSIDDAASLSDKDLVGFFVYYLTVESGGDFASAKMVDDCFTACDLTSTGGPHGLTPV